MKKVWHVVILALIVVGIVASAHWFMHHKGQSLI